MEHLIGVAAADLHFREKSLDERRIAWEACVSRARAVKAHVLLIAGDVFDNGNIVAGARHRSLGTIERAFLAPLYKFHGNTYIIPGNHDLAGPGEVDALTSMEERPRIYVMRRPDVVKTEQGINLMFLPWLTKAHLKAHLEAGEDLDQAFAHRVNLIVEKFAAVPAPKILVGHCEVTGAQVAQRYSMIGGDFELTLGQVSRINADLNILGHIHKRQPPGYVGALIQNTFGEEGNPTGYMEFRMADNGCVGVTYHEVDAPKYVNVNFLEDLETAGERDHVKLHLPLEELLQVDPSIETRITERWSVAPAKQDKEQVRRTDQDFDIDGAPDELLASWLVERGEELSDAELTRLGEMLEQVCGNLGQGKAGDLDRVACIELENIGRHKHTLLNLNGTNGLIAITGPNGAGKTYLMETVAAAAYGEFPSRPGKLLDRVTWGHLGPALVRSEVEAGGKLFQFTRRLRKTAKGGTQEAYVEEQSGVPGTWKAVAGPKAADAYQKAVEILGDPKLFLASTYSSQNLVGDLIDAQPSERKEILAGMLGSDALLEIGARADQRRAQAVRDADYAKGKLESLQADLAGVAAADQEYRAAQAAAAAAQERSKVQAQAVQAAMETKRALTEKLAKADADEGRMPELVAQRERIWRQEAETKKRLEVSERLAEMVPLLEKQVEDLPDLLVELGRVDRELEDLAEANGQVRDLEAKLTNLELEKREKASEYRAQRKALMGKIELLEFHNQHHEQAAKLGQGERFQAELCQTCPFLEGARSAEEAIQANAVEIGKHKGEIEALNDLEEEWGIDWMARREAEASAHAAALNDYQKRKSLCSGFDRGNLRAKIQDGQAKERDLLNARAAAEGAKGYAELLKKLDEELARVQGAIQGIADQTAEARQLRHELERASVEVEEAMAAAREYEISANQCVEKVGGAKARYERKQELESRLPDIVLEHTQQHANSQRWALLARAFNRDGIPQYIVDAALPQIHERIEEALVAFEGRFSMRLETQKVTQKGDVKEALNIIITNEKGHSADISEYSGGEQKLLRTLFRVGISRFQAQRSGRRHKVFMSDEAYDQLDREYASGLNDLFASMAGDLNQVILTSHNDTLISEVPTKYALGIGVSGTTLKKA